jgi:NADH-quinone oxidoreductase subunit A
VAFFELGWSGFFAVFIFIVLLVVALIYELSTGALDWGNKKRAPARPEEIAETPRSVTTDTVQTVTETTA